MRAKRLRADLILMLAAVIWGMGFVAQRSAAAEMGPLAVNSLRFLSGALVLLPWLAARRRQAKHSGQASVPGAWKKTLLLGLVLFAASGLQQLGLETTTTANAGFITGTYVVLIPLILMAAGVERPRAAVWLAAGMTALGLGLLSLGGGQGLALRSFNIGDGLVLLGAFFWALQVILLGKFVREVDIAALSVGQYAVVGLLGLAGSLVLEGPWGAVSTQAWLAVGYLGVFSTAVAFTLQALGQKVAPPADAAIVLSMEAVYAALFGWLLLGEGLGTVQVAGAGLILLAVLLAQGVGFQRDAAPAQSRSESAEQAAELPQLDVDPGE